MDGKLNQSSFFGGVPPSGSGGPLTNAQIEQALAAMAFTWEVAPASEGGSVTVPEEDMNGAVWIKNVAPLNLFTVNFPQGHPGIFMTVTADQPITTLRTVVNGTPFDYTIAAPMGVLFFQCMEPNVWRYLGSPV